MEFDTVQGQRQSVDYKRISSELNIHIDELVQMNQDSYLSKAKEMASEMAEQQMRYFFGTVDRATEAAGTSFDTGGEPFSAEMLLCALDKIELHFDEYGRPVMPTIVAGPKMGKVISATMAEADKSDEFRQRLHDLIQRKQMDWRDRETDRKLVG